MLFCKDIGKLFIALGYLGDNSVVLCFSLGYFFDSRGSDELKAVLVYISLAFLRVGSYTVSYKLMTFSTAW